MHDRIAEPATTTVGPTADAAAATASAGALGILQLQRTAGNAAVVALLSGSAAPPVDPEPVARRRPTGDASTIRRFIDVSAFKDITDVRMLSRNAPEQNDIIELLKRYESLGKPGTDAAGRGRIVVEPGNYRRAIALVKSMSALAELYLQKHPPYGPDQDPKRQAGFAQFLRMCDEEVTALNEQWDASLAAPAPVDTAQPAGGVVQAQETCTLSRAMQVAAQLVSQLAPNAGDQGEAKLDISVPVGPGTTLEFKFKFEVKRLDAHTGAGRTELTCEAAVGGGGGIPGVAKMYGVLGGYSKADGKSAEAAMSLISYGLYRRCRESEVIPRGLSALLWGGSWGDEGTDAAEDWSLGVENEELNDEHSYVETGGTVAVGVELGSSGDTGGEVKYSRGKRHDKKSLEQSKGAVGAPNYQDIWFGQKVTGRTTNAVEVTFALSVGGFGGDVKIVPRGRDSRDPDASPLAITAFNFEIRAHAQLPGMGIPEAVTALVFEVAKRIKQYQRNELDKNKRSIAGDGASSILAVEEAVFGFSKKPLTSAMAADANDIHPVGVEVLFAGENDPDRTRSEFLVDVRYLKEYSAGVPELVKASLKRRTRLVSGRWFNGQWTWDNALGIGDSASGEHGGQGGGHGGAAAVATPPPPTDGAANAPGTPNAGTTTAATTTATALVPLPLPATPAGKDDDDWELEWNMMTPEEQHRWAGL